MPVDLFNANFYRAANADLADFTDAQALSHFQSYGLTEGRAFSPFVNLNFYHSSNNDLVSFNNQQAFNHLQSYGVVEGRSFSEFVDLNFYKATNSDLASFDNSEALQHLELSGLDEGRSFSPFFNVDYYRASNPDLVVAGLNSNRQLLQHFETNGLAEGRLSSVPFDINYYRSVNSDLVSAGLNNQQLYEHFQLNGLIEGRASSPFFDVSYYKASNSDLEAAGFSNQQAYDHFVVSGLQEGRSGSQFPDGDYAGNTLGTARDIGVDENSTIFRDFVGSTDTKEFYRFSLNITSELSLLLYGLNADADVEVIQDFNNNGVFEDNELVDSSDNAGTTAESLVTTLAAGTYYINVYNFDGNTNYNLFLSALASAPLPPNNERDIGILTGTRTFSDSVSSDAPEDFYRFSLNTSSNLDLLLNGLSADTDVDLIHDSDNNGVSNDDQVITTSNNEGITAESLNIALPPGTYYVNVYQFDGDTNYNLSLSATAV